MALIRACQGAWAGVTIPLRPADIFAKIRAIRCCAFARTFHRGLAAFPPRRTEMIDSLCGNDCVTIPA